MSGGDQKPTEANAELQSSPDLRPGFIREISTGKYRPVVYSAVDGMAMLDGCIVLGTVEDMKQLVKNLRDNPGVDLESQGIAITGTRYRWKEGVVPYRIDANLPRQERVTDAIKHWEQKTDLKFPRRVPGDPNFITFRAGKGCSSSVGMQGGEQFITLGDRCTTGNAIHEIGHAIGLFHEQSREDRDMFVEIMFENIDPAALHNFTQHITDGDDIGQYEYGSIMHYSDTAFSKDGTKITIKPLDGSPIGQRDGLSPGDIATVAALYPAPQLVAAAQSAPEPSATAQT